MAEANAGALAALSSGLADAVERAAQSVVRVEARQRLPASGVLWPGEGIVVTADHVIEREEGIMVGLANGQQVAATLAGRDPDHDLALLKLASGGQAATLAPKDSVRIGHIVLAVGRPGTEGVQASWGLISALGGPVRTRRGGMLGGYIRTGVSMYPGFSGGALVDAEGRVAGILSSQLGGDAGMAVPAEVVFGVVATLQQHGRVRRAFLGFRSQPTPLGASLREALGQQQESGLLVISVESGSPAERAGLLVGDIVTSFAGKPVPSPDELQTLLATARIDSPEKLGLFRGGQPVELTVTPGERP